MITSAAVVAACTTSASTLSKTGRHRRSLVGIACSPVIFSFAREPSESPMLQKRFSFFALSTSSDRTKVKYKERRRRRWCKHGSATYERSATRKKRRKKSGGFYSRMIAASAYLFLCRNIHSRERLRMPAASVIRARGGCQVEESFDRVET